MRPCLPLLLVVGLAALDAPRPIQVERPLLDPAITYDADSATYYLTGTVGTPTPTGGVDFQRNDGAYLWSSRDGQTWQDLGRVWDYSNGGQKHPIAWYVRLQPIAAGADGRLGHAVTAPSLHHIGKAWYLVYGKNRLQSGVLKADRPQGPYTPVVSKVPGTDSKHGLKEHANESHLSFLLPGDPALFRDGADTWLVGGPGWIVPLTPELDRWTAPPRFLATAIPGWPNLELPPSLGDEAGAQVFRHQGRIYWTFAARQGTGTYDTWICRADQLAGPFTAPRLLIPGGGQARFHTDATGLHAACMHDGAPVTLRIDDKDLP
jgi:hypothetical protein